MRVALFALALGLALRVHAADVAEIPGVPCPPDTHCHPAPVPLSRHVLRGLAYASPSSKETAWGSPGCKDALVSMVRIGATAVSFCPLYLVEGGGAFKIQPHPAAESEAELEKAIAWARELGLVVILRPQLETLGKKGVFKLSLHHPEDHERFFAAYAKLLGEMAALARKTGCQGFSIGTRLAPMSLKYPDHFRDLARAARAAFPGVVTYDAGHAGEASAIEFWDALDLVSVTLYRRLGHCSEDPPTFGEALRHARKPTMGLAELAYRARRPLWISELGFPTVESASARPLQRKSLSGRLDPAQQALLMRTSLLVYQDKRWLSGIFVWGLDSAGGVADPGYSPVRKPVWETLKAWFAPGPDRDRRYYERRELVDWVDDWF